MKTDCSLNRLLEGLVLIFVLAVATELTAQDAAPQPEANVQAEAPKPPTDAPTPAAQVDAPTPAAEAPKADTAKPAADAPTPAAEEPKPAADAPKPATDAPNPTTAEPAPTVLTPEEEKKAEEDRLKNLAFIDLEKVDADYHDQGEYVGPIKCNGIEMPIGLQVMAMGAGNFDALIYRGGLPGNGYNGSKLIKLTGSRMGERVALTGEGLVVYLQTGYAVTVKNASGERLGFLQPIKRVSTTMGLKPPANAIVLFDGQNTDRLENARVTPDGLLEVGFETKDVFKNFTIHGEFRVPYMPYARGQGRGNSGFYLQRRYEVQVLDSFGLDLQFNDCASLYRFKAPDLNMSFPPIRWQTYDITFSAAKFAANGQKICKALITVLHNGVTVHNNVALENKTGGGKPEGPDALSILFQNHRNPVNYRNIWLVENEDSNCCAAPVASPCGAVPCYGRGSRRSHFRR